MDSIQRNDGDASKSMQRSEKNDGVSVTKPRTPTLVLDDSSMKTPSIREWIVSFLFMCCFAAIYNYGISFWEETTSPAYASLLPSWRTATGHWIDTWTASPQAVQIDQTTWPPFSETPHAFQNTTLRQTLQLTVGGEQIRIRLSNRFGTNDLYLTSVTVALPMTQFGTQLGSRSIDIDTLQTVTFSSSDWVIVPDGALAVSDPITFGRPLVAGEVLTVSIYLPDGQDTEYITAHVGSRTTSWMEFGDHTRAAEMPLGIRHHQPHWYFLSAVEVSAVNETLSHSTCHSLLRVG